jgi:hypothetical protein
MTGSVWVLRSLAVSLVFVIACTGPAIGVVRIEKPVARVTSGPLTAPGRDGRSAASSNVVRVVHVDEQPGFDWSAAGLGGAGGFALTMIAIGGALAISDRRDRDH